MWRLGCGQTEHAVLAGPFRREFAKARDTHSIGQTAFNGCLDQVGRKKGSEIVMLTLRALHLSRRAIASTVITGSVLSSFNHRRPLAIEVTRSARFSDRIGRTE